MSGTKKEFLLKIDEDYHSLIEEFSEYTEESEKKMLNRLLNESLRKCASKYNHLKNGYKEMGKKNLAISREFIVSENEALNRVDRLIDSE